MTTIFAQHLRPRVTVFSHNRSLTVGASEIGACARQVWMRKNGVAEEGEQGWGYGERGKHVERWVYDALDRAGVPLIDRQTLFASGNLSATLDGRVGDVVVDIKSFDPYKKNVVEPKHLMQVQVQIGLTGASRGVLLYVNASNYQDTREHVVEPDPVAYAAAKARATYIMTTTEPPPREGHLTGGNECRLCPYQTACLGAPIQDKGKLGEADMAAVAAEREVVKAHEELAGAAGRVTAAAKERIREILRRADARRAPGLARISRSSRTTLDQGAMERDGIDLSKYRKPTRETEQVTVE